MKAMINEQQFIKLAAEALTAYFKYKEGQVSDEYNMAQNSNLEYRYVGMPNCLNDCSSGEHGKFLDGSIYQLIDGRQYISLGQKWFLMVDKDFLLKFKTNTGAEVYINNGGYIFKYDHGIWIEQK
jgi:hypothetical protein